MGRSADFEALHGCRISRAVQLQENSRTENLLIAHAVFNKENNVLRVNVVACECGVKKHLTEK